MDSAYESKAQGSQWNTTPWLFDLMYLLTYQGSTLLRQNCSSETRSITPSPHVSGVSCIFFASLHLLSPMSRFSSHLYPSYILAFWAQRTTEWKLELARTSVLNLWIVTPLGVK